MLCMPPARLSALAWAQFDLPDTYIRTLSACVFYKQSTILVVARIQQSTLIWALRNALAPRADLAARESGKFLWRRVDRDEAGSTSVAGWWP